MRHASVGRGGVGQTQALGCLGQTLALGCLEANKYSYASFGCLLIGRLQ